LKIQVLFRAIFRVTHSRIFTCLILLLFQVKLTYNCLRRQDFRFSYLGFEVLLLRPPQAMISRETVISGNREILVTVVLRKRQVDNPP